MQTGLVVKLSTDRESEGRKCEWFTPLLQLSDIVVNIGNRSESPASNSLVFFSFLVTDSFEREVL